MGAEVGVSIKGDVSGLQDAAKKGEKALKAFGTTAADVQKKLDKVTAAREKARRIFDASGARKSIEEARAAVEKTKETIAQLEAQSGSFFTRFNTGFKGAGKSIGGGVKKLAQFAGLAAGGLGLAVGTAALDKFGEVLDGVLSAGVEKAREAQAIFEAAFGSIVDFKLPDTRAFQVQTRDQLVELGRKAREELNRINADLKARGVTADNPLAAVGVGFADQARRLVGLVSDQVRAQVLQNDELLRQKSIAESTLKVYEDRLAVLDETLRLEKELSTTGLNRDPARQSPRASLTAVAGLGLQANPFKPIKTQKLPSLLPDNFETRLANLRTAVSAGVVPALDGMRREAALVETQLLTMLENGVSPASAQFQFLKLRLEELRAGMQETKIETQGNEVAFRILGGVAEDVLSGIAFKLEEATNKAAKLRNTLRSIGNRLLDIGLGAGIQVGIGALTGNPLSFGAAIKNVLGIPAAKGAASGGATVSAARFSLPSLSLPSPNLNAAALPAISSQQAKPVEVRVTGQFRYDGDAFLVDLRNASNQRGGGPAIQFR